MTAPDDEPLPPLPDDLRALVGGMQDDPLEDERVARVRARLGPVLPPGGGTGGGGGAAVTGGGKGAAWKLAGIGAVALLGAGVIVHTVSTRKTEVVTVPAIVSPVTGDTSAATEPAPAPAPASSSLAPSVSSVPDTTSAAPAATARPAASTRSPTEAQDVVAEEDILHRARAALATSPQTALDLTAAHARTFPHGVLAQEREVVAIDALGRLGRTRDAAARATRFRAHFPGSPYVQELKNRGLVE